jgi:hypothetical protein
VSNGVDWNMYESVSSTSSQLTVTDCLQHIQYKLITMTAEAIHQAAAPPVACTTCKSVTPFPSHTVPCQNTTGCDFIFTSVLLDTCQHLTATDRHPNTGVCVGRLEES